MDDKQVEFLVKEAQAVFSIAMRVGYAGGIGKIQKTTIPGIPGSKCITWQSIDGRWKVVDTYVVNRESFDSSGMTVIAFEGAPIWVMHYGGFYKDEAIPFLKKCLAAAYKASLFNGGRGPQEMREGNLRYSNLSSGGTFRLFEGKESIEDMRDEGPVLGVHWYRGGMLLTHLRPE